jgi:S-DNA-T family DNA segregation ATPase FtsK/SpoIIIE
MLPTNTPNFYEVKDIDPDSEDFQNLETICFKALSNLANCEMEDINSKLESAKEGFFSYELRLKRINKVKKTDDLARELENYLREDSDDEAVTATVAIEGDFYKITVSKGTTAVVTFGDIFRDQKNADFYLNTKNKLPVIMGIDALGHVMLEDAKLFDSMLIAGKPRSGKSWYVLSIIFSMMLFNSPEDVQFCIIDPKESNLFKTIALMPHVFGLHNHKHINQILDDLIEVEAPRRKKLLDDNRCDDIWALQKKGFKLPVIWLVIDEFMTVVGDFDDKEDKDAFNIKLRTLLSQLPSLGIRLLFVPHRATGIVDKTQRTLLQFTAAVRADTEDVKDTLGIMKWDRALVKPGDIALKTSTMKNARYVRGAALTTEDAENTIFIERAATAFYKMGVDIPDMSNMRVAYNRNEDKIKKELGGDSIRVQYNASNIFEDIENDSSVSVDDSIEF